MNMNLSKLGETVKDREAGRSAVHRGHKEPNTTEWLNNKPQTPPLILVTRTIL